MTPQIKIASAQFNPYAGDIQNNIAIHLKLIKQAIEEQANLIIFPELSLTGYEPSLAATLCFSEAAIHDLPFQSLATQQGLIIMVGAPLAGEDEKPKIGVVIFMPDKKPVIGYKIHLHETEKTFFSAGKELVVFDAFEMRFGMAICFDSLIAECFQALKEQGVSYCLAPSLITAYGFAHDLRLLRQYAKQFQMGVIMSNYVGNSGGLAATGNSLIIDKHGDIQVQASQTIEEIMTSVCS